MKHLFLFVLSIPILFSCSEHTPQIPDGAPSYHVQYFGALKNMMHRGDLSAKAKLSEIEKYDHVYALGAIEDLKGEIQIYDGTSYNTKVDGGEVKFDPAYNKGAALLVYSIVEKWKSFEIHEDVRSMEDLQQFIEIKADEHGIDIHAPFPFLVEGAADSFDWHVINWPEGDTVHTHQKHVESGLHGTMKNKAVELLGFYSDSHHTIFTHHTTNMHIHFKTNDNQLAGHIDDLTLGKDMKLLLPDYE